MLETQKAHLSAAIQSAIVDVLFVKIERALEVYQCKSLAVVGGVASNQALKEKLKQIEYKLDHPLCIPSPLYCTDNAAMIAAAGAFYYEQKNVLQRDAFLSLTAYPLSLS